LPHFGFWNQEFQLQEGVSKEASLDSAEALSEKENVKAKR